MSIPNSPTALLQELIRIPSVNPDNSPNQGATGEKDCAMWVGRFLENCGAEVIFEEVLPNRPNVIARFPSQSTEKAVLFAPHTDTVSVSGMTVDPFGAHIVDGRVYGRGASDTKGTMAAMLWALFTLKDELSLLQRPIAFVGLMGEEAGQPGSSHFAARHGDEFDFALVGEPTSLATVHAHKGCVWLELQTKGRSCHGSTPHEGVNAIRPVLDHLPQLIERIESLLPNYGDETLGAPTLNVGMINGGTSPNIVPGSCSVTLDFRETPALNAEGGSLALVQRLLTEAGLEEIFEIEIQCDAAPLLTPPETDGVRRLQSIGSQLTTAPWFCDAGRLSEGGIPSVACGPGSIAQAHTKDEFLEISDLDAGVEFYQKFIQTYQI